MFGLTNLQKKKKTWVDNYPQKNKTTTTKPNTHTPNETYLNGLLLNENKTLTKS